MNCQEKIKHIKYLLNNSKLDLETDCLEWQKCRDKKGYGVCRQIFKTVRAHRTIYQLCFGEISDDLVVRHLCNNPSCINPEHLASGTVLDNAQDRIKAGHYSNGADNPASKLTEDKVKQIKFLLKDRTNTKIGISKLFNISPGTVSHIAAGSVWSWVETPDFLGMEVTLEENKRGKLTEKDVKRIKLLLLDKSILRSDIAKMFNISSRAIRAISGGVAWKQVI